MNATQAVNLIVGAALLTCCGPGDAQLGDSEEGQTSNAGGANVGGAGGTTSAGGASPIGGTGEGAGGSGGGVGGSQTDGGSGGGGGAPPKCADAGTCPEGTVCSAHSDCASALCGEGLCAMPLALWRFDTNFASDGPAPIILMSSGQAPTLDNTDNGKGAHFIEQTGGHLFVANDDFNLVQGNLTILARVKFDIGATSDDVIVAKTTLNATADGWSFLRHSDKKLSWCYSGTGSVCLEPSGDNFFQAVSVLTDTEWWDVAVTRDSTHYRLYVNGAQENQVAIESQIVPSTHALHVGRDNSPPEVGQLAGTIDHLLIVRSALTEDEVAAWQPP